MATTNHNLSICFNFAGNINRTKANDYALIKNGRIFTFKHVQGICRDDLSTRNHLAICFFDRNSSLNSQLPSLDAGFTWSRRGERIHWICWLQSTSICYEIPNFVCFFVIQIPYGAT